MTVSLYALLFCEGYFLSSHFVGKRVAESTIGCKQYRSKNFLHCLGGQSHESFCPADHSIMTDFTQIFILMVKFNLVTNLNKLAFNYQPQVSVAV
jgi:hypothetical protein